MATTPTCRACAAPLDAADKFCGFCGTKVDRPSSGPLMPDTTAAVPPVVAEAVPPRPQPQYIAQRGGSSQPGHRPPPPSSAFAIVTLLCYVLILSFPIGALLNVVGLITGPRRGCFAAMLGFILLPVVLLATTVGVLYYVGAFHDLEQMMDRVRVEDLLEPHEAPGMDDGPRWQPPTN